MEIKMKRELKEFYKGKKVFITGHTGFKGAWLSQILVEFGSEVMGYALDPREPSLFTILHLDKNMESKTGDIRDLKGLKASLQDFAPEIVIHMAAQPLVLESYENPVYTYDTNVMGTVNILEAIRNCKSVRSFLNVTTDKVYKNKEWEWGYRENENLCGYDPYSNSKSCSELVTYSYKHSFFNYENSPAISTARSGNVIGGGDFADNRIIPDCVRAALKGEKILVRNPNSTRPYQHVLECLYGYLLLCMKQYRDKENYEGNYNFGPDEENCVTTGELVYIFCEKWGDNLSWYTKNMNGPHEANFLKLDTSKAKKKLAWRPTWNIEVTVEKIVELEKHRDKNEIYNITKQQIYDFFGE